MSEIKNKKVLNAGYETATAGGINGRCAQRGSKGSNGMEVIRNSTHLYVGSISGKRQEVA
jgi:hypothetical protein